AFQELKVPFDANDADTRLMTDWFARNSGLREAYQPGVDECRGILERLGDHAPSHLDLAGAYLREEKLPEARLHAERALELGFAAPGLARNMLAVIAQRSGQIERMQEQFLLAARSDPQHYVLIRNVEAARSWFKRGGPALGLPLELDGRHDFQLFERTEQPTLPGPLPPDVCEWPAPLTPPRANVDSSVLELPESHQVLRIDTGQEALPFGNRRLPVV
ncbi:MAG TPA: B12-binding domain-containing radical SAM protein, partial [Polyangiaceae bacterium]|nr:B12-binding domain-containing radical SAM protein [Polyangiaceae bacterium]